MSDSESIARLVHAARRGDERAFAALVRAYQDIAVAYATSILGDYHLAEDAAQEAFRDAYRALPSLRAPAAFGGWLRRIVLKHCDRLVRRKSARLTGLDAALDIASAEPSPLEALERRETRASLRAAIATLSAAEQQVVLLYYMGDHSQAAIADFLNVNTNVVKTRLYSARRRLRAHMSDIENDLHTARPSSNAEFAEKVRRLIQPEALKQSRPWMWSTGIGTDVWALFCACIMDDLATVERLVDADPSLVRAHYEYRTALHFAVRENHVAVAAFLLDRGADPLALGDVLEMAQDRGYTGMAQLLEEKLARLHGASSSGEAVAAAIRDRNLADVRRLLDASPELLHAGDTRSNQPIHWAVMTRQLDVFDELLERGADINAARQDGARPIHLTNGDYHYRGWRDVPDAVVTSPDDVYQHLVAKGAYVDLGMAAAKGDIRRVRELLADDPTLANRVADYNSYYIGCGAPLKNAAAGGHIEIVKLLLAHGADPNLPEEGIAPNGHALYSAVYNGHYEIAKLLLEHGAYPNPEVESSADAVWIAIRRQDRRLLELLASYGATWKIPLPLDGALSYHDIVATGLGRSVEVLAYYGDMDTAAARFATDPTLANDPAALSAAATNGHADFVRLLLQYQTDLARRVTVSRPREMAELLFAHGMDANRPNWVRRTPLHDFASHGDLESAALFLDHGADLHARDEDLSSTPLAHAARAGQRRMVEFLLRRGALPRHPDDPPWATPLAWATRKGRSDIVALLMELETKGALPVRRLEEYESLARDLVAAHESGDDRAFHHIIQHFGIERAMMWDRASLTIRIGRLRRYVRERLGHRPDAGTEPTLALDDARLIIARAEGYVSWTELVQHSSS